MTSCISPGSSLPDGVVEPKRSKSIYRPGAAWRSLVGQALLRGWFELVHPITSSSPIARHLSAIAQHDAEVSGPGRSGPVGPRDRCDSRGLTEYAPGAA